jgi:magnesium chelatase family protein
VLFLDELPEFRRDVLEAIRQPLEERRIALVRVGGASVFPCDFLLVAAMNPCPCGRAGSAGGLCACGDANRRRYTGKISGPLLDRIDLCISVPAVTWADLERGARGESSAAIRERVDLARRRGAARAPSGEAAGNARLTAADLEAAAPLDRAGRRLAETAVSRLGLSVRGLHRALRVARTIADLGESERVEAGHLSEAISYRLRTLPDHSGRIDTLATGP